LDIPFSQEDKGTQVVIAFSHSPDIPPAMLAPGWIALIVILCVVVVVVIVILAIFFATRGGSSGTKYKKEENSN